MTGLRPSFITISLSIVFGTLVHGQIATDASLPAVVGSESEAIISEKDSVDLVDDSSVGESISRRPDLSFDNVTINGQGSGMSLGSIPADAVESVEVMKAVTPDLDADTRNGAISLKTKPTYEQKLVAKGTLELEYKATDGALSNEEIFSWGGRLNEAGTWGGRLNVRSEKDFFQVDTITHDWTETTIAGQTSFVLSETQIESFHRDSDEFEIGGNIDFKASEQLSFSARANSAKEDRTFYSPRLKFRYDEGAYTTASAQGVEVSGANVQRVANGWNNDNEETEISFGTVFENDFLEAELQHVNMNDRRFQPDFFQLDFVMEDVDLRYNMVRPGFPVIETTDGSNINDPSMFVFEDLNAQKAWLDDESDASTTLDFKIKDLGKSKRGFFKLGFKTRERDTERVSADDIYDDFGPSSYTLADVAFDGVIPPTVESIYDIGIVPDSNKGRQFLASNLDSFEFNELRTRERADPNTFSAQETVDSLYAMFSWDVEKWRSIVGWRQEQTQVSFNASEVIVGPDADDLDGDNDFNETVYLGTNPTVGDNSYSNDFPNFHVQYRWNDNVSVIGSFTNTIERPEYGEVVPFRRVNRDELRVSEGNPALNPTLYENFDLSLDIKMSPESSLSVELFRKSVEDIVFSSTSVLPNGVYSGYELSRDENGPTATMQGANITWQSPLRLKYMPEGFSFNANYVLNDTETEYPNRAGEFLPVTGIPDSELRFSLNYQTDKIFAQLLYERTDTSMTRVAETASEDRFDHTRNRINFDFSYKLNPKLRYFLVARDIRSDPNRVRYEGNQSRPVFYRNFHWSIRTGFKFEI